jgi:hypothetical protein
VSSTAIRKSSKIKDLIDEFIKRAPTLTTSDDLINYQYFMVRLHDIDLSNRLDNNLRLTLVQKAMDAAINDPALEFDQVIRAFGDASQLDPATPLANKINEMLMDGKHPSIDSADVNHSLKLLKYIYRSKNPRLYLNLAKTVVNRLPGQPWR